MFGTFDYRKHDTQTLTPTDRKRNRDRRAQQRLRIKRLQHIEDLERQVAHCNAQHGGQIRNLPDARDAKLHTLEQEMTVLREDAQKMSQLVDSLFEAATNVKDFMAARQPRDYMALRTVLNADDAALTPEVAPQTDPTESTDSCDLSYSTSYVPSRPFWNGEHGGTTKKPFQRDTVLSPPSSRDLESRRMSIVDHIDSQFAEPDLTQAESACEDSFYANGNTFQDLPLASPPTLNYHQETSADDLITGPDCAAGRSRSNNSSNTRAGTQENGRFLGAASLSPLWQSHAMEGQGLTFTTRQTNLPPSVIMPNSTARLCKIKAAFPWLSCVEEIATLPALPKPIELLFGSRGNALTHDIHEIVRSWRVAEAERLANGWIAYVYFKWIVDQSEASLAMVPPFLRPLSQQLGSDHPAEFDMIYWPVLRLNLIKLHRVDPKYSPQEISSALSCCAKVRWPWGKEMLIPDNDGNLNIEPEFLKTFSSIQGWGLTREFINTYPSCLTGIDTDSVLFTIS